MALAYRNSNLNSSGSAQSITVNKPSGTIDGDLVVIANCTSSGEAYSRPSGFTYIASGGFDIGYKIASSEPSSYTFGTTPDFFGWAAIVVTFTGVDRYKLLGEWEAAGRGDGVAQAYPSLTVTRTGALCLAIGMATNLAATTPQIGDPTNYACLDTGNSHADCQIGYRFDVGIGTETPNQPGVVYDNSNFSATLWFYRALSGQGVS